MFFKWAGVTAKVATERDADKALFSIYIELLNRQQTTEAALLLWGIEMFDPRPRSVRMIWEALHQKSRVLIPGGSAQGKSFTPAAWSILFWTHDPMYTSIKVVSVTSVHAAANILATIKMFHTASVIKLPGEVMDASIDLRNKDKRASIMQVSLPVGEDVKARMRGFHPVPRPYHHLFGVKTRTALLVDEGEDVPSGIWEGIDNLAATDTADGTHIKVISGANPKKRESHFAQRCEPPGGWQNFDLEKSEIWTGPAAFGSWHVVRLDPARSENVLMRREVYPGLMTYEGWMNYVRKGSQHPDYFTFARGAWPESNAEYRVTPADYFTGSAGTFTFSGDSVHVASFDPAFAEGGDNAVLTTGRYGTAIGWTDAEGTYNKLKPHKVIQIEQQFNIQKANTLIMAQSVMQYLRRLDVRPEWFIMDRSGNAHGLCDALKVQYGGDILGQMWSEGATEKRILEEDSQTAEEKYSGVNTEMAFAFAAWLQYGYVKFAPYMDINKIYIQAINRKYTYTSKGLQQLEDKTTFKAGSGSNSPDEYDSAIMLVHLARLREAQRASMLPPEQKPDQSTLGPNRGMTHGTVDVIPFVPIPT